MSDEPMPTSATRLAEEATDFGWDGQKLERGIGIALSGGGFRAMLFHGGALARLNELVILSRAKRISSVSGGSIAAGHLAASWDKLGKPSAGGEFANFKTIVVESGRTGGGYLRGTPLRHTNPAGPSRRA
jgi:NTE family protein